MSDQNKSDTEMPADLLVMQDTTTSFVDGMDEVGGIPALGGLQAEGSKGDNANESVEQPGKLKE